MHIITRIIKYTFIFLFISVEVFSQIINVLPTDKQSKVDEYLEKSRYFRSHDNIGEAAKYLNEVAFIYLQNGNAYNAIEYFSQSIALYEKTNSFFTELKIIYSNLGLIYTDLEDLENAYKCFDKSLQYRRRVGNRTDIASGLLDLAYITTLLKDYEKSNQLTDEALEIATKQNDPRLILNCYKQLAKNYDLMGNVRKSQEFEKKYLDFQTYFEEQIKKTEFEKKEEQSLILIERERAEKEKNALQFQLEQFMLQAKQDSMALVLKARADSLKESEQLNILSQEQIKTLEYQQQMLEAKQREQEARERTRDIIIYAGSSVLAIIMMLTLILMRINRARRRSNIELAAKGKELEIAYKQIEAQNVNITKSINYAKGIQKALLPNQGLLNTYLPDSFIFFRPRDIVSGDFYFFNEIDKNLDQDEQPPDIKSSKIADPIESLKFMPIENHKFVIAAVDCTGHGVPGAFMSMIGYNLLDEIISKGISRADLILNELHKGVRKILKQDVTENRDGMDLSLCIINRLDRTVSFAGAENSLLYIQNGEVMQIKGDRYPIGGRQTEKIRLFNQHIIKVDKPTCFYIFSDGYIDQFGGPKGRKFLINNLRDMLFEIHHEPMEVQCKIVEETFDKWLGSEQKQIDDVLVIGFRLG